ncbi:MAG: NAD-dependent epimerase/dehydratase family protein [Janthinobacterium lividum]
MRVLLTGATGFVGQSLLPYLAACGHDVIPVVRGASSLPGALRWDLGREQAPTDLPEQIDAVVHAAQSRNHREFPKDGPEMFAVNTAGTAALLDYATRAGASRFCFLSTGTVYEPFRSGLAEETSLAPTSALGASKLAAETVARPYGSIFSVSILRLFTPYGPGQTGRLIPNLIGRVRAGEPVQVSADGEGMRLAPFYVDDLCTAIELSLVENWRGTINIAAPDVISIRGIAETMGRLLGREPVFAIGTGAAVELAPPVERLGRLLDLKLLLPFEEGLARTITAML